MSSREASPNSITYQYETSSPARSPSRQCYPEHDILSKLKVQVFEKDQNKRNYNTLLCKFHQLQEEFGKICEIKKSHEIALQALEADQRNKDIIELKNRNENLFNDLNERIAMNKKLYSENNSLFHELEVKASENQDLQEHICEQEIITPFYASFINYKKTLAKFAKLKRLMKYLFNNWKPIKEIKI